MLKFLEKKADEKSLLCVGRFRAFSKVFSTPIRVLSVALGHVKRLLYLRDVYGDVLRHFDVVAPIVEMDLDVGRDVFRDIGRSFDRYADYICALRREFGALSFMIPFFSADVSRQIVQELSEKGRSTSLSVFLSSYVDQECADILSIPVLKIQVYDRETRKSIQVVNVDQYIRYLDYAIKYFEERVNKPFFIPFPRFPDRELPKLLEHFIDHGYTRILLDYEGSSYKKLSDIVRLLQIEYDRVNLFDELVLYGTRILRETVSKRGEDEVKFADVLALAGLDFLGSNFKKRIPVEEGLPLPKRGVEEFVERFFNNETYGYRHERFLREVYEDLYEVLRDVSREYFGEEIKKLLFKVVNVKHHRGEAEKFIDFCSRGSSIDSYLKLKEHVRPEDIDVIRRALGEHTLDEYL